MSKLMPLTQGQFAIVDDEDYQELIKHKWYANKMGLSKQYYAVRRSARIKGRQTAILMHRKIMNTPEKMVTDHINHNTLDNKKTNLRNCSLSQNNRNRRISSNNTTGIAGVSWNKTARRWEANIHKSKQFRLGYFKSFFEACCARKSAEIKIYKTFSYNKKKDYHA